MLNKTYIINDEYTLPEELVYDCITAIIPSEYESAAFKCEVFGEFIPYNIFRAYYFKNVEAFFVDDKEYRNYYLFTERNPFFNCKVKLQNVRIVRKDKTKPLRFTGTYHSFLKNEEGSFERQTEEMFGSFSDKFGMSYNRGRVEW